jgi:hypothetical protein
MRRRITWLLAASCSIASAIGLAQTTVERSQFDFGEVVRGSTIEHSYRIRNASGDTVHIHRIALTPPLRVLRMPAQVAPGTEALVAVHIDTTDARGHFDGRIVLFLDDPAAPQTELEWSGRIVDPIEIAPVPAFYLAGQRGDRAEAALTIINHTAEPLHLGKPMHPSDAFVTRLETMEEGKRYRLTLTLLPDGPVGKHTTDIEIDTSSTALPMLRISANTNLHERVYAFPDTVDLGGLRLEDVQARPRLLDQNSQTLMVYRKGTSDFIVTVSTDVPGLVVDAQRGPAGDRYQLTVRLHPQNRLASGAIRGSIFIETNDREFPRLTVPVIGAIIDG